MRFSFFAYGLLVALSSLLSSTARADVCTFLPGTSICAVNVSSLVAAIRNVHDTPATKTVDAFATEFVGQLQGGPVLFDQSFAIPFNDPSVASIVTSIKALLTGAASGPLSFLGPTLVSSVQTSSSNQSTVVDNSTFVDYLAPLVDTFGPNTVLMGQQTCTGVSVLVPAVPDSSGTLVGTGIGTGCTGGTPYNIPSGQFNIGIESTTVTDVFQTTTDTTTVLTSQIYSITGEPLLAVAVPEPGSLITLSGALAFFGVACRRQRPARKHAQPRESFAPELCMKN
jgi:hypothetical protein